MLKARIVIRDQNALFKRQEFCVCKRHEFYVRDQNGMRETRVLCTRQKLYVINKKIQLSELKH